MEQIRKGNDIKVYWEIITGGDGSEIPYELEGKALELYAQNSYEKVRISDFVANGNVIEWTFYGKDQKIAGEYSLTLIENNGSEGMRTVDECNAFELVTHSCKAGGNAESRVSIETVRLRSVMTLSDVVPDKELNKNSTNVVENGAIAREFEKKNGEIAKKQDIIPDLAKIREGASKGATALQEHQDISGKADTSGRYPEMSVGFSDDLVGRGESVPAEFSFRASGGKSIKDGTARIKRLKGNSVVWNNMVDTRGYEGKLFITTGIRIVKDHKYLLYRTETNQSLYLIAVVNGAENYEMSIREGEHSGIFQAQYSDDNGQGMVYSEAYCGACIISDLTKMFGAGYEPTTIEEYNARKPIVADEYAYNEGEVIHMTAEGIKSVGDNAWDEEWEMGDVSGSNGVEMDSTATWRNKGYIRIIPNEYYYIQSDSNSKSFLRARFYDADKNFIGIVSASNTDIYTNETFKTAANAHYMRFAPNTSVIAQGSQLCVSLVHSGWKADTDAGYQPYWEDRLMFDKRIKDAFPDGMSKWDMVYNKNGKGYIVHGLGVVEDMSKMDWERNIDGRFQASIIGALLPPSTDMVGNIMCNRYTTNSSDATYLGLIGISLDSYGYVWVRDDAYTDVASLKESLQGVPLYYQLAEPTIIEYDEPFNLDYKVADFGTEEIIAPQPSAPISADIIYQFNAVDMIREHELEITELQRIIATMQAQLISLTSNNGGQ